MNYPIQWPTMGAINYEQLPSGLWLLAEPIASSQSLSMSLLAPGGVAAEPEGQQGVATMLAEMVCRGAGSLGARPHSDAMDRLGVQRGTDVEIHHLCLSATMVGDKIAHALPLLLDMIRRPLLAEDALEPSRDLSLQALEALEDEPQQRVMLELRQRHFPQPFERSPLGRREHLEAMSLVNVHRFHQTACVPDGSILAFAGKLDWPRLRDQVLACLDDWSGRLDGAGQTGEPPRGYQHLEADTAQAHLAVAYDTVAEPCEQSILQRAAAAVLSGGMSSRLFTEVREKRGLCYAVHSIYVGQRERGAMFSYAGTTVPRAQETLDVMTSELTRLAEGVGPDEFERAKVGMKSRLVMQGESTAARAAAIAADQYTRGRPRTLSEMADRVEAITLPKLNAFLRDHPPGEMSVVTIGPSPLKMGQQTSNCQ